MKNLFIIMALLILSSCKLDSADKKVPELANEMCDCFTNFQKDISPNVMMVLKKVAVSANPQQELQAGLATLKPEEAKAFVEKLAKVNEIDSEVNKCMQAFDKKHSKETTQNKKELTQMLLKEMQANTNCTIGAVMVNLGLQQLKDK